MYVTATCALIAPLILGVNMVKPVVEVEEVVYKYTQPDNGAGPMWCYGSTCIVRNGDVFVVGSETVKDVKPLNNCRWVMYKRDKDGWSTLQADPKGLQREPCPLGTFSDGALVLSTNPTLNPLGKDGGGPANPHILKFSLKNPKEPGLSAQPVWEGAPRFNEHSYRGLGVDSERNELVLINNYGYDETHWSFMNKDGKWENKGIIKYPIRGCYHQIAVKNGTCHMLCIGDILEPVQEWGKWKKEQSGRDWDFVFRRLFYVSNPDIAHKQFSKPVEIENLDSTAGYIQNLDLLVDKSGDAHILYRKMTVQSKEMRDKFFPDTPLVYSLEYCIVRNDKVINRQTLIAGGDGAGKITPWHARFHKNADNRLFVLYHCNGTDSSGKYIYENRIMEIYPDGRLSDSVTIPLKHTFNNFMTATERGGSAPSDVIDLLGSCEAPDEIRYARIRLK